MAGPTPYTGEVLPLDGGDKPTTKQPYTGPVLPAQPAYEAPFQGLHDKPYEHPLEFPDAPTTGHMPLPKTSGALDLPPGEKTIPFSSSMALQFGPLLTSDPKARQEIYVKHLPGAKAVDDKYGNPMIEYQGKKYYTSRPGEFDAMDAGRAGLATAAAAPAMLLAPESVVGASIASGAIAGGQSLSEDALTQAAGGTSQKVDATKAGLSAVVATLVPLGLGKAVLPLAGKLFAFARSGTPLTDEALTKLGFTPSQVSSLTPELRDRISTVARQTFGNSQAAGSAYRGGLSKEFNTDLTRGEISGDPGQIAKEQTLAAPGAVPGSGFSRQTMTDNRGVQNQQLTAAQEALRGGGQPPLNPEQAGTVLKQGATSAEAQGANKVDQLYQTAKDPTAVVTAGGAPNVPAAHVQNLGAVIRSDLATTGPGRAVLEDPSLTPNAAKALGKIDELVSSTQPPKPVTSGLLGPNGQPLPSTTAPSAPTPLSWEQIDNQRKLLLQYRDAAFGPNGTKTDQAAMSQIIKNFDDHFGQLNPLLKDARAAHAEQMSTFKPGGSVDQDRATQSVLGQLQGPEGGTKVMNTILGGGLKKGEAEQMMDHLVSKVLPGQPEALQALKDQALRRLVVDANGNPLGPQKAATALGNALDGDAEKGVYAKLFSSDELARLRRFKELQDTIAKSRTPINPPGSGTIILDYLKHAVGGGIGAKIGATIGAHFGMPDAGMYAGATAGTIARTAAQRIQAARAINPPANYGTQGLLGTPAMAAGQAAGQANQQQPGPIDRLWQGLLGP